MTDELTVPRVAHSIEDLRAGMTVAWIEPRTGEWDIGTFDPDEWDWTGTEVILSEPPAPPYVVPREAVERLREAIEPGNRDLRDAILALLDAAEEQA